MILHQKNVQLLSLKKRHFYQPEKNIAFLENRIRAQQASFAQVVLIPLTTLGRLIHMADLRLYVYYLLLQPL